MGKNKEAVQDSEALDGHCRMITTTYARIEAKAICRFRKGKSRESMPNVWHSALCRHFG